jgi:hypothetical protein
VTQGIIIPKVAIIDWEIRDKDTIKIIPLKNIMENSLTSITKMLVKAGGIIVIKAKKRA